MKTYEVIIYHYSKVILEAKNKHEAQDLALDLMDKQSPELEYIGYEAKASEIK